MSKLSIEMKEIEDELHSLMLEKAELVKKMDDVKYRVLLKKAEKKACQIEEKADKE